MLNLLFFGTITTTEYAVGFEYENNVLLFMQHAEGYTEPNGQGVGDGQN